MDTKGLLENIGASPKHIGALITIGICTTAIFLLYRHWDFDDSFIVYRLVERILAGSGWTYNDGEAINVSTSVLNTLSIVLVAKLGLATILAAHIVSSIGLLLTGYASYLVFQKTVPWLVSCLFSCLLLYFLATNRSWGLEFHLFIGLFFLFMALPRRDTPSSQVIVGFMILARPDGLLLPMIQMAQRCAALGWRHTLHRSMLIIPPILLPWIVFSLIVFHKLFPDTLAQKMWQGQSGVWGHGHIYADYLLRHLATFRPFAISEWLIYPFALLGLALALFRSSPLLYFAAFVALQQMAYLVLNVPGYFRYTALLDAMILVCAMLGLYISFAQVVRLMAGRWNSLQQIINPFIEQSQHLIARPIGMSIMALLYLWGSISALSWAYAYPLPVELRTAAYRQIAQRIQSLAPEAKTFAAVEVGVFAYYLPKMSAIDLTGLTSSRGEFVTGKRNDLFFARPADILIAYDPPTDFEKPLLQDQRFAALYTKIGESTLPGFSSLAIFRMRECTPENIAWRLKH